MLKRISISFWPALVTLTAFLILCKLGFWQLQRAEEKRQFLQAFETQGKVEFSAVVDASQTGSLDVFNGRQTTIAGEVLMPYVFFVDNKIHQGSVGYSLLAPVQVTGTDHVVIVDFGWLKAPRSRQQLPKVSLPKKIAITGQLKTQQLEQFSLQQQPLNQNWPQRIQSPHSALELSVNGQLLPLILYAPSNTLAGMPQTYRAVVMPPEKHHAYALQWFLLALASILVFYFAAVKRSPKEVVNES